MEAGAWGTPERVRGPAGRGPNGVLNPEGVQADDPRDVPSRSTPGPRVPGVP
jgi:hypothetical protein